MKSYHVFWLCVPSWLILAFLRRWETFDVQMHDTYYVFPATDIVIIVAVYMAMLGFAHKALVRNSAKKLFCYLHLIFTIVPLLIFYFYKQWQAEFFKLGNYSFDRNTSLDTIHLYTSIAEISLILFFIAQVIFFAYFLWWKVIKKSN